MMMYLMSWSGGKDSCLACWKAIQSGHQITHLMNFVSAKSQRVSFHGVPKDLIQRQADAVGLPLIQKEVTSGTDSNYETVFKETLRPLIQAGLKGLVCGDIYLQEHKQWLEAKCAELGIELVEPLWGMRTEDIMAEFINSGFEAILVSAKPSFIDKKLIGHKINTDFVQYLKTNPYIDLCGENGEYHTFVVNGPLFKKKVEIKSSEIIEKETPYGKWYFLDIK